MKSKEESKSKIMGIRMNDRDQENLKLVSEHYNENPSVCIRRLIHREAGSIKRNDDASWL